MSEAHNAEHKMKFTGKASAPAGRVDGIRLAFYWKVTARDPDGNVIFYNEFKNIVVNTGLDDCLDKWLKGSAYTAAFYVGLTDGTPTVAAGDTMASHVGWTEVTAYSEGVRQTLTLGSVSGQSVDNSASKATYSINASPTTIGGAFVTTDNTKGGSSGTLIAAGAFTEGDFVLNSGSTLEVEVTHTASAT